MTSWMKKLVFVSALAGGLALAGCNSRNAANEPGVGGGGNRQGTFSGEGTTPKGNTGSGLESAPQEPGVRESQGNPTPSEPATKSPGSKGYGGQDGLYGQPRGSSQDVQQSGSLNTGSGTSGMAGQPNTKPGSRSSVGRGQSATSTGQSEAGMQRPDQGFRKDVPGKTPNRGTDSKSGGE